MSFLLPFYVIFYGLLPISGDPRLLIIFSSCFSTQVRVLYSTIPEVVNGLALIMFQLHVFGVIMGGGV